jgi:hypothetical protein
MVLALVVLSLHKSDAAHDAVTFRVVIIQLDGPSHKLIDLDESFRIARLKFSIPSLTSCRNMPSISASSPAASRRTRCS